MTPHRCFSLLFARSTSIASRNTVRAFCKVLPCLLLLTLATTASAAPSITRLSLHGLRAGGATTLVIEGTELDAEPQIMLAAPIAKQELKQPATPTKIEIEITLDAAIPSGIYQLRVANQHGVSGGVAIGIDSLPQKAFGPEVGEMPVALNGELAGEQILRTTFEGKAGQPIVIDVEARRLGSKLNPVLHLSDPRNVQVAWSQLVPSIAGDARIVAKLPVDGRYTVELHDALYRGEQPGFFRLKIGDLQFADMVYPLGAQRGAKNSFELVGANLPAGTKTETDLTGAALATSATWPPTGVFTGGRPQIIVGDLPEVIEQAVAAGATAPQPAPMPGVINGRLSAPREEDRYILDVVPGQNLRFDVQAARAGAPLDGVLSIRKETGEQLAGSDDRPTTTDPGLDFKIPDGVNKIVVALKDLLDRGGPDYLYRIEIAPVETPDFRLTLLEDRHQTPRGGAELIRVRAARTGYNGPIKLSVAGLPAGVTLVNDEIPAGATDTLLTVLGNEAPLGPGICNITGVNADGAAPRIRPALAAPTDATRNQPGLRNEIAMAITPASSLAIQWEGVSPATALPLGGALPAQLKITRVAPAAGVVRLTLITSQIPPTKEVGKDAQKKTVEDIERTLRLEGSPQLAADAATGEAKIIVPADLPAIPYDVAIKGELLSADGKSVIASAVTPAIRLATVQPLKVAITGEPKVEAKSGSGETGQLKGTIERVGAFAHPVTVTLAGLPTDFVAPAVEVPADKSEFSLPVQFAFNSALGDLAGVSLVATAQPSAGLSVRSNEVPVAVKVIAGGPPPALYKLFEDEPHITNLLNEGNGALTLEALDVYSGSTALRVTPDQKFRAKMPGLGVKIVEKPGEGEYRYLRYAWKKLGGGSVLLQLSANGAWGPARGQGKPAYRYEAGPAANPLGAETLKVSEKLPYGWTVVTRDLFADFGEFQLDGLALTPADGEAALFDHIYLARSEEDFKDCTPAQPAEPPLAIFEDQPEFVANLTEGMGTATLVMDDKLSGAASVKVTPDQRYNATLPGLGVKIRRKPKQGEYRYIQYAWKKHGGQRICLQMNHDGLWGPNRTPAKFRYDTGPAAGETFDGAVRVSDKLPEEWVVVTRDLFADNGEFTLNGLALSAVDGEFALFDHIYLGRTLRDFDLAP